MTTIKYGTATPDGFDGEAAVSISRQTHEECVRTVAIDYATVRDEEFVVGVYDAAMELVGASDVLGDERFEGEIGLDERLTETQTVTVMLHHVEDGLGGPIRINDIVVLDNATVQLRGREIEVRQ
ncbi:MAG: hypothetical protein IH933_14210 [Euryarchaeota archaeon]|jgi:hypothetical protein|nr:hypothetical protein [Euryarchaeota archaeon]